MSYTTHKTGNASQAKEPHRGSSEPQEEKRTEEESTLPITPN
ncbi:hypothetical protein ATHL_02966, partial [Anaerolinea thermolimosa]